MHHLIECSQQILREKYSYYFHFHRCGHWGIKELNNLPKALGLLSCWVKNLNTNKPARWYRKMKTVWFTLFPGLWMCSFCFNFCWWQNKATIILLFFFFNIDNFQSVNKLHLEVIGQGSLKSLWFIDRHCYIRISPQGLIRDGKLELIRTLFTIEYSRRVTPQSFSVWNVA